MAKQENILPKLPFESQEFFDTWSEWTAFRKENNWPSYKPIGYKNCIRELLELSENNEQKAIAIIRQSLAKGWRGFFPLKNTNTNGQTNGKHTKHDTAVDVIGKYFGK